MANKLDDEVKQAVVWGGYYRVKHRRWDNDQSYGTALPVLRASGEVWMVDTYELKYPGLKDGSATEAAIDRAINVFTDPERGDWVVSQARMNYYYNNTEHIESVEALNNDYELICDLHDFRLTKRSEDVRDFASEDIISRVRLYCEHGYSWDYGPMGVELIRKGAKPVLINQLSAAISDIWKQFKMPDNGYLSKSKIAEAEEYINRIEENGQIVDPKLLTSFTQAKWVYDKLDEMAKEIDRYLKETKYAPHFTYEDSAKVIELKTLPDVERYLENDCYCPHEVYDAPGRYFSLFYPTTKCVLISEDKTTLVLARSSNTAFPELLSISYTTRDDGTQKVSGITRFDVTDNNIKALMYVNQHGEMHKFHSINEYAVDDNEFTINERIEKLLGTDGTRSQ